MDPNKPRGKNVIVLTLDEPEIPSFHSSTVAADSVTPSGPSGPETPSKLENAKLDEEDFEKEGDLFEKDESELTATESQRKHHHRHHSVFIASMIVTNRVMNAHNIGTLTDIDTINPDILEVALEVALAIIPEDNYSNLPRLYYIPFCVCPCERNSQNTITLFSFW